MDASVVNVFASRNGIALLGAICLVLGGAAMIASVMAASSEEMARRIALATPRQPPPPAPTRYTTRTEMLQRLPWFARGLTDGEQRLVILLFSKRGAPSESAFAYFLAVRFGAAAVFAFAAFIGVRHSTAFASSAALQSAIAFGAAIVGWIAPAVMIAFGVKRRARAVATGLPEALELLVVCVEAGLSLEDGLYRVAHELEETQPALADELSLTWAELNILPSREAALANLVERIDDPGVRAVVGMLAQSLKLGTPLARSLRVGAREMRNDQLMQMEEKVSRLPALLTIPVMVFIMPTIFLLVGGPAALRMIDIFTSGH